ncbi:Carboxy-cis cis-muconate cyclase [Ceratocystis platani]|uniref:Carboxy-cis cis-muconate cyclase n=1 Tax=Ceratocystis fimbriata f. sp. platani TaxID=88771 RepID=A0A0F8BK18_CERFI|nr:Carboxy-cis cis-muconate cyclase [Ceratocystis platani]
MPVHHLMIGTWTPPGAIFTVSFNDETLEMELVKRTAIPEDEPISWMAFSHDKKNLYGSAMKKWSSFAVKSPTEIVHEISHPMLHDPKASSSDTNTRAIFLLPAKQEPFSVYCNPFYDHAGHGSVFSVDEDGKLQTNTQNYEYQPNSGIHGMVFDPSETYLYSADLRANKLWVHRKDSGASSSGNMLLVGSVDAPDPRDHPRWVAMHPTGNYLYALMEKGNRICEYVIDSTTKLPVYTHRSFPLIPPGIPDRWTMYRADVCAVSFSGKYLFASSRSNSFDLTGYMAAFRLDSNGSIERQICLNPTPTSGGHSNAVAPCDWSDEWVAITDDQEGWVEMYRWQDEFFARVARLSEIVSKNGGSVCAPLDDNDLRTFEATHIISTTIDFPQYVDAQAFMIPVVSHHWIQQALTRGKLPQLRPYSPDPRLIFSNVVVTCSGLSETDTDTIVGATMALGGTENRTVTRLTTHICAPYLTEELSAQAKAKGFRGVFVIPHWFNDCFKLGKRIDETPYTLPNMEVFTTDPKDNLKIPPSKGIVGAIDPNPAALPRPVVKGSRAPLRVFQKKAVMLGNDLVLANDLRTTIADLIKESGGSVVDNTDDCDMYIGRYRYGKNYVRASHLCKDVGNLSWLYHLIVNDQWTSPLRRLLHYPIPKEPLKGFEGLKITVSNYGGEARTYLENLITAAGASFTKTMKNDNTHLVTARRAGEKCEAAVDWGIEIVSHLWVEESYANEVLGQTFFDEAVLRDLYYPGGENLPKVAQLKRRIRDVANDNVFQRGPAKGTLNYMEEEPPAAAAPKSVKRQRKTSTTDSGGAEFSTPTRQIRAKSSTSTTAGTTSFASTTSEMDIDTPVTAGRSAKSKAAKNIQNLVADIKLYERENKRTNSGGVWGGRRAADELEKAMRESTKGRRTEQADSKEPDGDGQEAHTTKKRKALPDIKYRIMTTGFRRWSNNPKLEEREKARLREFGIKLVEDGNPCQYLAAPKVLRTLKFLKTLARGPILINTSFIDGVLDQDTLLDPVDFLLQDEEYEKANNVNLQEAVARARINKGRLLAGVPIFCSDHVANGKDTYRAIAEANGATWRELTARNVIKPEKPTVDGAPLEPVYLLSSNSPKEQRLYTRFVDMAVNGNMEPRIVLTEWLLAIAIKQEMIWDEKYLVENEKKA